MVDSVSAFGCRLVDPSLSAEDRAAIGLGPDPLVPALTRPKMWWNPWKAAARRKSAVRELERPYPLVGILRKMQADAVRFRDLAAAQPASADVAHETARSLAWLLWHTADRIDAIIRIEDEIAAAGLAVGDAKVQWVEERRRQAAELQAPMERAAADVHALAALAEETTYAARLALEREPTLELAAPTAREIGAADDLDAAADVLTALRQAWGELDVRLRGLNP